MAMNITFEHDGEEYVLEYNEAAIKLLDKRFDFSIDSIGKTQLSDVPDLFYVSFLMHHPRVTKKQSDAIYKLVEDKYGLLEALVSMYTEAVNAVFEEPEEGKGISWRKNEA